MNEISLIKSIYKNGIFKGCNVSNIISLEHELEIKLPTDYKEFLLHFGNSFEPMWAGSEYEVENLVEIQEWARELLIENNNLIYNDFFTFWMHQGYQFCFFLRNQQSPKIYYFNECIYKDRFIEISESIFDFVIQYNTVFDKIKQTGIPTYRWDKNCL